MEVIRRSLSSLDDLANFVSLIFLLNLRDSNDMPTVAGNVFFPEHLGEP